jgi:hypothetical protein
MKCRQCGLLNPEGAVRCDCGHELTSHTLKDSRLPIPRRKAGPRQLAQEYAVCCGIGAIILLILSALPTNAGETLFTTCLVVAARIIPGGSRLGREDIVLLWPIAFVMNAAVYGFVIFCTWRALKSLIR